MRLFAFAQHFAILWRTLDRWFVYLVSDRLARSFVNRFILFIERMRWLGNGGQNGRRCIFDQLRPILAPLPYRHILKLVYFPKNLLFSLLQLITLLKFNFTKIPRLNIFTKLLHLNCSTLHLHHQLSNFRLIVTGDLTPNLILGYVELQYHLVNDLWLGVRRGYVDIEVE